jgi:eukaryotic-like serine/threonine-protein kinase
MQTGQPLAFAVGDKIGDSYRITGVLGRGGMAQVFEAEDLLLHRRVAIKVALDPTDALLIRREAQALATLRHPAIPIVYGLSAHRGLRYFVFERLYGATLEQRMLMAAGKGLPIDEATTILLGIAEAVGAVHAAGMAHRDLKPGNVMLCTDCRIALLDFGIVLPEIEVATSVPCGTPRYMAPEGITATVAPGRAYLLDIYAFGAMAFELLTGRVPFEGDDVTEILERHLLEPVPDLALLRPDAPPALVRIVEECLAKDPAARPPGFDEILWQLRHGPRRIARGTIPG